MSLLARRSDRQITLGTMQTVRTTVFMQPFATADTLNPVTFRTVFRVKVAITNNIEIIIIHIVVAVAFSSI
jgi:hypothetical protein